MRLVSSFVRANYLATVVFGPALAVFVGVWSLGPGLDAIAFILALMCLYVVPGARAIRRMVVRGALIPPALLRERPIVAGVVSVTSAFGHLLFALCVSVIVDITLNGWPEDAPGGPLVMLFATTLLSYLIALLCGELVLVGNGEPDPPRASRSLFP